MFPFYISRLISSSSSSAVPRGLYFWQQTPLWLSLGWGRDVSRKKFREILPLKYSHGNLVLFRMKNIYVRLYPLLNEILRNFLKIKRRNFAKLFRQKFHEIAPKCKKNYVKCCLFGEGLNYKQCPHPML